MLSAEELELIPKSGIAATNLAELELQNVEEFLCAMGQPGDEPGGQAHSVALRSASNAGNIVALLRVFLDALYKAERPQATPADHELFRRIATVVLPTAPSGHISVEKKDDWGLHEDVSWERVNLKIVCPDAFSKNQLEVLELAKKVAPDDLTEGLEASGWKKVESDDLPDGVTAFVEGGER